MVDFSSLSKTTQDRLVVLYDTVKEKVYEEANVCNNWVKKQYFESRDKGFPVFVDDLSYAMSSGEISWYSEDEDIIEYCFSSLKLADFLYQQNSSTF